MEHLGKYINKVSRKLIHTIEGIENTYDLSTASLHVLGHLAHYDKVYQGDFEELLHIRRSSISSILSNLEGKGYIERIVDQEDTRKKQVILTPLGKQVEKDTFQQTIVRVETKLNDCLTKQERDALIQSLNKLSDLLDKIQEEGLDD